MSIALNRKTPGADMPKMLLYLARTGTSRSSLGQPVGSCLGFGGQDQWAEPRHGEELVSASAHELISA